MAMPAGLSALANPAYRRFATGYAAASLGTWMRQVSVGYLVWSLTGSPFWLGAVALAEFLPILLLTPTLGVLLERLSRKAIVIAAELTVLAVCGLLLVLTVIDAVSVPVLLVLALVAGTAVAIGHPAQLAWYPALLSGPGDIGSAANLYILTYNVARFLGAGIAGAAIAQAGVETALALILIGQAVFVGLLWPLPDGPRAPTGDRQSGYWRATGDGYRYALAQPIIGGMLVLIGLTSIGGRGIPDLAPAIAEMRLAVDATWFSALVSATGMGSILAGMWRLGQPPASVDRAVTLTRRFAIGMAISALALAMADGLVPALLACVALGFSITVTAVESQLVIQTTVAEGYRGRVNALYFLTFRGGTALGAFAMGVAATQIGLIATLAAGAGLCLVALALTRRG